MPVEATLRKGARCLLMALVVWAACAWPAVARAQAAQVPDANEEAADEPPRGAQEYAEQGARLMEGKQYEQAIKAYHSAYEFRLRPIYLFYIGQAYRRMGRYPDAREWYQRYLREDPATPLGVETEELIKEVEDRMRPVPLYRKLHKQWWFWTVLGSVVTGAVVAGVVVGTRPVGPIILPIEHLR